MSEANRESTGGTARESNADRKQVAQRALPVVLLVLAVGLLLLLLWLSVRVWLLVFAGVLLAIFLRTLSNWLSAYSRLGPIWALVIVVALLTGLGALAGTLLAPQISRQFSELADQIPKGIEQLRSQLDRHGWTRYVPDKLPPTSELMAGTGKMLSRIAGVFTGTVEAVTGFFVVLFLGLYLAAAPELYIRGFLRLFPISKRNRATEIMEAVGTTLRHWVWGQIISMIVIGTLVGIGLRLLGIPLPLALGILAGLFDFVPIVGPLVSAVPAFLLGFSIGPLHALYVVLLYLLVNSVIESHLLVPLVQQFSVALPPALTVVSLLVLGMLFGFLGLLLATPLTAAGLVLVKMIYVEDVLGDRPADDSA